MKKLLHTLILALSLTGVANATGFSVTKAIPVSSYTITQDKSYFLVYREVCTDKDVKVEVFKRFTSLSDKNIIYRDRVTPDYGFKGDSKCESGPYPVTVPKYIPNGEYLFNPTASINEGETFIDLPTEILIIDR